MAAGGLHAVRDLRRVGVVPGDDARRRARPASCPSPGGARPDGELPLRPHRGDGRALRRPAAPARIVDRPSLVLGARDRTHDRPRALRRLGADVPRDAPPDRQRRGRDHGPPRARRSRCSPRARRPPPRTRGTPHGARAREERRRDRPRRQDDRRRARGAAPRAAARRCRGSVLVRGAEEQVRARARRAGAGRRRGARVRVGRRRDGAAVRRRDGGEWRDDGDRPRGNREPVRLQPRDPAGHRRRRSRSGSAAERGRSTSESSTGSALP